MIIAVDGPSGSGKSSAAKGVARRLGYEYLDTGAMYRAVTWLVDEEGIDPHDHKAVEDLLHAATIEVNADPDSPRIAINSTEVTAEIREPSISARVSAIATNHGARHLLVGAQQAIIADVLAAGKGIVVEGRDIATVVAPEAPLKVLLTADPSARMARRQAELSAADRTVSEADVADQIVRRDRQDATVAQFDIPADGAVRIDSTHMTLDEVVDTICAMAAEVEAEPQ